MSRRFGWPALLLLAALWAVWPAGLGHGQDEKPAIKTSPQKITFRVLNAHDRPVSGAHIEITPSQGVPLKSGPWRTGPKGECELDWLPLVVDQADHERVRDLVYALFTGLRYRITAQGFWPAEGEIQRRASGRQMASPELASLNLTAKPKPYVELVVLKRPADLLGPGFKGKSPDDPLLKKLLAFHEELEPVAENLGATFAWPSFSLEGKELSIIFDWRGMPWAGLKQAPLKSRVAVSAGLPMAMAVGEDLTELPGIDRITIAFASETSPPGDPHALPRRTLVSISAPLAEYRALAQGRISPDKFLDQNPLTVSHSRLGGDGG